MWLKVVSMEADLTRSRLRWLSIMQLTIAQLEFTYTLQVQARCGHNRNLGEICKEEVN